MRHQVVDEAKTAHRLSQYRQSPRGDMTILVRFHHLADSVDFLGGQLRRCKARTAGTIIQTAALRNALPAVVSSGAEVQDAQRTTQGYHALRPLDSAQECGLGVALWQAFFIQSYSKRTQQGDQKTDHCAEFANLLS